MWRHSLRQTGQRYKTTGKSPVLSQNTAAKAIQNAQTSDKNTETFMVVRKVRKDHQASASALEQAVESQTGMI